MPVPILSVLARVTAGALIFQATAPLTLAAKQTVDVSLARRKAEQDARSAALVPPKPMKGVPSVKVTPAVSAPLAVSRPSGELSNTYLNDVARRPGGIEPSLVRAWQVDMARPDVPKERRAWLNLWLGESRLASEEPDAAEGPLARAATLGKGGLAEESRRMISRPLGSTKAVTLRPRTSSARS